MPHSEKIERKTKPSDIKTRGEPRTRFKDHLNSVEVDLIYWPNEVINLAAYAFQEATWRDIPYIPLINPKMDRDILSKLDIRAFNNQGLPLSIELYDFIFCIKGINRIVTHQIVRNRIGATYSQQCSGDKDWRHHDVLVPRSIYHNSQLWPIFQKNVLEAKLLYSKMLDSMSIPILDARKILPQCLETFIYVKFSLNTLQSFIRKRDCTQTQEPEMVMVARRMRECVINKFPKFKTMLEGLCDSGKCFYTKSDRQVGTSMFIPDNVHDFTYNKGNFIYQKTVHEMIYDLEPVKDELFVGLNKVDNFIDV